MKEWTSNAEWPTRDLSVQGNIYESVDYHETESAAEAVCRSLRKYGLGGECVIFPVRTWVSKIDKGE